MGSTDDPSVLARQSTRHVHVGGIWACKIGECDGNALPPGSDGPMRDAVERAYRELTGQEPEFTFSGWSAELNVGERACVDDRVPDPDDVIAECRKIIDDATERLDAAVRYRDA